MLLLQALKIEWAPQCQECLFCGQECIVNYHSKIIVNEGKHIYVRQLIMEKQHSKKQFYSMCT